MARIKSTNTKPERLVRSLLHNLGFRFRLNRNDLPGKPDIVLPKYRVVIFVHGCFWHSHPGCKRANTPLSNIAYWNKKLARNHQRDLLVKSSLENLGWRVLIVWECETRNLGMLAVELTTRINNTTS